MAESDVDNTGTEGTFGHASDAAHQTWTVGFVIRLAVAMLGFGVLLYGATDTLVRALTRTGYSYSYRDRTSSGYSYSPAPSLSDAGWAFLLGPGSQLVIVGVVALVLRRRRTSWVLRLRVATWWLLALDAVVAWVIYTAALASVV